MELGNDTPKSGSVELILWGPTKYLPPELTGNGYSMLDFSVLHVMPSRYITLAACLMPWLCLPI